MIHLTEELIRIAIRMHYTRELMSIDFDIPREELEKEILKVCHDEETANDFLKQLDENEKNDFNYELFGNISFAEACVKVQKISEEKALAEERYNQLVFEQEGLEETLVSWNDSLREYLSKISHFQKQSDVAAKNIENIMNKLDEGTQMLKNQRDKIESLQEEEKILRDYVCRKIR